MARDAGRLYNPLFIYGGTGLGKTHLLHAIGHFVAANHPERIGKAVIALAAARVTTWGHDVDRRWAQARAGRQPPDRSE